MFRSEWIRISRKTTDEFLRCIHANAVEWNKIHISLYYRIKWTLRFARLLRKFKNSKNHTVDGNRLSLYSSRQYVPTTTICHSNRNFGRLPVRFSEERRRKGFWGKRNSESRWIPNVWRNPNIQPFLYGRKERQ